MDLLANVQAADGKENVEKGLDVIVPARVELGGDHGEHVRQGLKSVRRHAETLQSDILPPPKHGIHLDAEVAPLAWSKHPLRYRVWYTKIKNLATSTKTPPKMAVPLR